ncbi:alpha/beta fold hydrolase [Nocardioides sp. DS6]|uniref:Alpha/beta fold hydrolase n=1 Tax=Nocardioides eburneus TaxID=3231482 RepID=A0ABV3T2I9_9ACTN
MSTTGTDLHVARYGEAGSRVVFCHGLFGQGRNWTQIAKALADAHRTVLVDLPNHGRSPWHERFDYVAMADEVAGLLDAEGPAALVGHSMGGKVAMLLALRRPDLVERLCVVDMSPVTYHRTDVFEGFVAAMRSLDLSTLSGRQEADDRLAEAVPDPGVRGFLLQNLRRDRDSGGANGWRWQMNLDVLGDSLGDLASWPEDRLTGVAAYDGPVLWIAGQDSGYVKPEYDAAMTRWFPRKRLVTIKGAGHWVHSEQPQIFVEVLRRFLA